ncbi:hypothetical protein Pint_19998 [Pistacia integerrima]|uniref:Uncharacterized protein n=1 Tax=Pistacia integerrima TaxID=434235 RepID=A0ACC0X962_9ROSI|nr:hypothetical protein Pint_19998 [Pistacia integerrima]
MLFILLVNSCLLHTPPIVLLSYGFLDTSKTLSLWVFHFLLTPYYNSVLILMSIGQRILLIHSPSLGIIFSLVTHSSPGELRNNQLQLDLAHKPNIMPLADTTTKLL